MTKWTESCKQSLKHTFSTTEGNSLKESAKVPQKTANERAEKFHINQEKKLQTKAGNVELELSNQAQLLLDQLPVDVGEVKQELETERTEHDNKARQDTEAAQSEKHQQPPGHALTWSDKDRLRDTRAARAAWSTHAKESRALHQPNCSAQSASRGARWLRRSLHRVQTNHLLQGSQWCHVSLIFFEHLKSFFPTHQKNHILDCCHGENRRGAKLS